MSLLSVNDVCMWWPKEVEGGLVNFLAMFFFTRIDRVSLKVVVLLLFFPVGLVLNVSKDDPRGVSFFHNFLLHASRVSISDEMLLFSWVLFHSVVHHYWEVHEMQVAFSVSDLLFYGKTRRLTFFVREKDDCAILSRRMQSVYDDDYYANESWDAFVVFQDWKYRKERRQEVQTSLHSSWYSGQGLWLK